MRIPGNESLLSGVIGNSFGSQRMALRVGGKAVENCGALRTASSELSLEQSQAISTVRESFERIDKVMQGMKLLSLKGEESLSEDDRLLLQSRMAEFQSDLHREVHSVALKLAGKTYESTLPTDGAKSIMGEGPKGADEDGFYSYFLELGSDQPLNQARLGVDGLRAFGIRKLDPKEARPIKNGATVHFIALVATGKGNVLESHTDRLISALAEAGESGKKLSEVASEQMFEQDTMMLTDPESSAKITERIDANLQKLDEMSAKFERLVEEMKESKTAGKGKRLPLDRDMLDLQNKMNSPLGEMAFSFGADLSDLRLIDSAGPLGEIFAEVDSFFKDEIYSDLGVKDTYFRDLIFKMDNSLTAQTLFDHGNSKSRVSL